ncbi:PspC domain-containing protein [Pyrococcus abyssi]|uniref:Transcription regulator, PspC family n=1 Tax=Pyrococcus abyssi (strain GE5 / Orsay) TaxID=272844 RepID=Q9V091_PYRAB|nr:PspC domain-containing protein [Pyrococcus abyssi]CAB49814.1 Transcriptional regulator, containing PspC domain, putative [Pyrococcus abyssi GE5]CCE70307.1 TPA: transcription regulator, PspC family [Pyrococcus abyssi GE5]
MDRKLYRAKDERMFLGVLGGIAKYLNVDATIIRLLFLLFLVLNPVAAIILYFGAAIIMPEEPGEEEGEEELPKRIEKLRNEIEEGFKFENDAKVLGLALILLGLAFILKSYVFVPKEILMGGILVVLGLYLIVRR